MTLKAYKLLLTNLMNQVVLKLNLLTTPIMVDAITIVVAATKDAVDVIKDAAAVVAKHI